ncbi:4Fe-4S dicluster domain-containing protein [Methylosinus sp. C49]|uniref:4Fe-4S dicluster domain-containing protein n=1 Tax=Methylosinus sp. C49 TaxID=2699395 RepID=UPI001379819B|nr:4Fe-4S dicluster domain-containing protein [Methylosinus sp. C49]
MEARRMNKCRQAPGVMRPVVDAARCEGKADCVSVCPYNVFEIVRISKETFDDLPVFAKLKVWAHGMKTAATPNAPACEGCGYCVAACPEQAIRLERARV